MTPPDGIACAHCGNTLHPLTSYGLSTPVDERRIRASDFCDLACLAAWCSDVGQAATGRRQ